jgi:hypothetical protein
MTLYQFGFGTGQRIIGCSPPDQSDRHKDVWPIRTAVIRVLFLKYLFSAW